MKHAFLHKNFRELSFEKKVILLSHGLTMCFCFLPWFQANPAYESAFYYNAFQGNGFLTGTLIFLISLSIVGLFADRLFERGSIHLPFSENYLYLGAGLQQVLLLFIMWSILLSMGKNFSDHEIRFGIFLTLIAQITGVVSTWLNMQLEKKKEVKKIFQHPTFEQTVKPKEKEEPEK